MSNMHYNSSKFIMTNLDKVPAQNMTTPLGRVIKAVKVEAHENLVAMLGLGVQQFHTPEQD